MKVIIDECIYSPKFMNMLKQELCEHDVIYLGKGLPDSAIETYMFNNQDSVLITADVEFDTHFGWTRSVLVSTSDSLKVRTKIVRAWLDR